MDAIQLQPSEGKVLDMEFAPLLIGAEAISTVDSVDQEKWDETNNIWVNSTDLTFGTPVISGSIVQVHTSGTLDGVDYKVTILVTTDSNPANTHEGEGMLIGIDL